MRMRAHNGDNNSSIKWNKKNSQYIIKSKKMYTPKIEMYKLHAFEIDGFFFFRPTDQPTDERNILGPVDGCLYFWILFYSSFSLFFLLLSFYPLKFENFVSEWKSSTIAELNKRQVKTRWTATSHEKPIKTVCNFSHLWICSGVCVSKREKEMDRVSVRFTIYCTYLLCTVVWLFSIIWCESVQDFFQAISCMKWLWCVYIYIAWCWYV